MHCAPFIAFLTVSLSAQDAAAPTPPTDRELVRLAVLDYVEGIYDVTPARIERSVDPALVKRGFGKRDDQPYRELKMSYDELVALAGKWNSKGWLPADAPKEVQVLDVLPRIACAKLTAHWGTDYMQLVKGDDGRWRIRHVLWQTPPLEVASAEQAAARGRIEKAVQSYAQAFYLGKPDLLQVGVHAELAKYGFHQRNADSMVPAPMTFTELEALVERVAGSLPKDGRQDVTLLDVQDQTAIVKLVAEWGIDYMHVGKFDGKWQTIHVAWQSHPPASRAPKSPDKTPDRPR